MATTTLLPTRIQRVRIGNVPRPTSTSTPDVAHTLPDWAAEKRAFGSVTEPATSAPKATILPDVVVVELSTAITINHFSEYYGVSPTDTSQPRYHRLGDGSLVADPLVRDMQAQHVRQPTPISLIISHTAILDCTLHHRNGFFLLRLHLPHLSPHSGVQQVQAQGYPVYVDA